MASELSNKWNQLTEAVKTSLPKMGNRYKEVGQGIVDAGKNGQGVAGRVVHGSAGMVVDTATAGVRIAGAVPLIFTALTLGALGPAVFKWIKDKITGHKTETVKAIEQDTQLLRQHNRMLAAQNMEIVGQSNGANLPEGYYQSKYGRGNSTGLNQPSINNQ